MQGEQFENNHSQSRPHGHGDCAGGTRPHTKESAALALILLTITQPACNSVQQNSNSILCKRCRWLGVLD